MAIINSPPNSPVDTLDNGIAVAVNPEWRNFFVQAFTICNALSLSGTTANRPTRPLWPGRMYYDTSLGANGKPIWVNKGMTGWVLADGTAA